MNPTRQLINSSGNYTVQICLTENSKVDLVTRFIKEGLLNGEAIIIIAKPALRKALKLKIDELNFDGHPLQEQNQIRFFDAEFLLSYLTFDGVLEESAFKENIAIPLINPQSSYKKVRAFGEMVDILWKKNQHDLAIQLEGLWESVTSKQELSFLCAYSLDKLEPIAYDHALEQICKYNSHLIPQKDLDPIGEGMGETILSVFGAAWDRVINKPRSQKNISTQMHSVLTTILN